MKKRTLFLIAGYIAILLFTFLAVLLGGRRYAVYVPNSYGSDKTAVALSSAGVIENVSIERRGDYSRFLFRTVGKGTCTADVTVFSEENEKNYTMMRCDFTVLPTGVLYMNGYDYGGWQFTLIGMALIVLYTFALSVVGFLRRKKTQFFSYGTMLRFAFSVFFGLQSLMYLGLIVAMACMPAVFDSWRVFNFAGFIMMLLFGLSIPAVVLFAVFLSLSNLTLIRREGFGRNNLFGILISLMLFVGSCLCVLAALKNPNSTNVELGEIRDAVLRVVISTAFVYSECLLFSAMFCTQYAAWHEPKYNQDFIIILGCRIGDDGKPMPLLQGRIDRALAFYRRQLEETGRQACFIPSGGQGGDEVMSEAACMKNYLIGQGIDASLIFPETESTTTLENMLFSRRIADAHKENANILFSTTNYHIFRSGIFAAKAGMRADGVGAKTKWYFWPNAQMREFIGLLASEWKLNLLFVVLTVFVSVLFANLGALISLVLK